MFKMKHIGKKLMAALLAVSMIVPAGISLTSAKAAENDMLVHYDFSGLSGTVADGTAIADISGNGNNAAAKGSNLTAADGVLTLPGGSYGSGAGYVELPKGLFDGKDNLTVSMWLKNETGAGNYTAFYFGSEAGTNGMPANYFILNPCNPSGVMKMVLTDSVNASAPFSTEVGPGASGNPADSYATDEEWALYTVVFTEDTITGYLDGVKYKTYNTSRSVSDLGSSLVSYIGKSPYADMFYDGGVKDVRVYASALTDAEVEDIYTSTMPEANYAMTIDTTDTGADISQELFGLFYEDINSAADGGLNPQLVKNNSFENYFNVVSIEEVGRGNQYSWKLHWVSDNDSNFVVGQDASLYMNENNTNYAIIKGNMNLTNGGFAPMNNPNAASMGIEAGQAYDFSIWTRANADYSGTLTVQVVNEAGTAITDAKTVSLVKNGQWNKSETLVLTGKTTQQGKIKLTISGADASDVLYMDMVSLSSQDTYGYGDRNYSYGLGIRKDLVEMLMELKPSFVRFPGGCIIEGNSGRESYYNWEWSVGPLEERKAIGNHWASDNGSYTNTYGYMQSFGFGYHEVLQLCEDMGAEPFPILSAGVFCQFANWDQAPAATGAELDKFAGHATHLIDYCWGDPDSSDATQAYWASKRVENGHEEPFNLNYIGIGNENWQAKYFDNFEYIKAYVERHVAANYPGRSIKIISSAGPAAEDSSYQYAWRRLNENSTGETLVDEHYYQSREFMLNTDDRYDYYNRLEDGGSDVFLGEYATHLEPRNNVLESAICDAAYMTGIERNGDIVRHASYAPLLEKAGCANWATNLIYFDDYDVMATPNYYVQKMYGQNYGETIVNTVLEKDGVSYDQNTGSPIIGTWATGGYITSVKVTREDGTVLLNETFNGTSGANWQAFPGTTGTFTIANGRMTLSQGSGMNCVWLPDVVNNPEWHDYKVEVTAVKTSGSEGFLIGAGAKDSDDYIWYNIGGWNNSQTVVERSRTGKGKWIIGNDFGTNYQAVNTNEEMYVTFNYGVNDKIQAYYTTASGIKVDTMNGNLRAYQNDIYHVSSMDDEYVYLKLVNHDDYSKYIDLDYSGFDAETAEIICLSGQAGDYNVINNETVVPVTVTRALTNNQLTYKIPAMSFTVIKVPYNGSAVEDEEVTTKGLIADFDFDTAGSYFDGGNAKAAGSYTLVANGSGQAVQLNGNQFLTVTAKDGASLLSGLDELTVSFQIKPSSSNTNWAFFAAPSAAAQNYLSEHYLGIFDTNGTIIAERFNSNNQARPSSPGTYAGYDGWYHVTVVYASGETILYVNGAEAARASSVVDISDMLGSNSVLYIGKAAWGSGEYATAVIDNYKIYNYALTAGEVADAAKDSAEDESLLAYFDFDTNGSSFEGGKAKATGTYSLEAHDGGQALKLSGGQFLTVTAQDGTSLLKGLDEMTISFQMNPSTSYTNWAFYAAPSAATQSYLSEHYLGIFDANGTIAAERFNSNSQARPASASEATGYGRWYHVAVVYASGETILYVNGAEAARESSVVDVSDLLGSSSVLYIGKAAWGGGEYYTGLIDNYKIYGKALSANEVAAEAANY